MNEWCTIIIDFLSIPISDRIKVKQPSERIQPEKNSFSQWWIGNFNLISFLIYLHLQEKGLFILHFAPFPRCAPLNTSRSNSTTNNEKGTGLHSLFPWNLFEQKKKPIQILFAQTWILICLNCSLINNFKSFACANNRASEYWCPLNWTLMSIAEGIKMGNKTQWGKNRIEIIKCSLSVLLSRWTCL